MSSQEKEDKFESARRQMVEFDLKGRDITEAKVLEAMARIPRQEFIPQQYKSQAYNDGPIPVGLGQTISQPYIVALMTQELELKLWLI